MAQRDAKQKPIHQLEMKVMQELQPQLDEVIRLELECKEAELGLQMHAERCEATRTELAAVKERGLGLEELATLAAKLRLAQEPTPTVAEYTY